MTPEQLTRLPEILFQIGKVIGSSESLPTTLSTISQLVTELSQADACSVLLVDPQQQVLSGKAAYGLKRDDISAVKFQIGEGIAGWVAEHAQSVLLEDAITDERFKLLDSAATQIRSLACVPLVYRENVVGALTITSSERGVFAQDSVALLQLVANTIALDLENIRLRRVSVTDKLTGTYNREFLDQYLPSAVEDASRLGESLSIAMLDVDHFKRINDTHGHGVGDDVLATIADRLQASSRDRDRLIRYGGEEFLLLLPCANLAIAAEIADRVRIQFQSNTIEVGELRLDVRVSVGVAQHQGDENIASLMQRADAALYQAKNNGRNRVEVAR